MEIKVRCVCGSVYSFDDTPVESRLKFPVSCTNCGADGTEKAHAYIAHKLSGGPDPTELKKEGFSFFKKKNTEGSGDTAQVRKSASDDDDDTSSLRLSLATAGALAVGAVCAWAWLLLAKATGFEFGYAAWAIGGLVGLTARALAPRGHDWLGVVGGAAALVAILGGEMLTARWAVDYLAKDFISMAYRDMDNYAKRATMATSEDEFRELAARYKLATLVAGENPAGPLATFRDFQITESPFVLGQIIERDRPLVLFAKQREAGNANYVTPMQLAHFKAKVLPELQALADGKPSQQEYESALHQKLVSRLTFKSLLLASMGPFSWLWVILGIGTAYKVAHNRPVAY